MNAPGDRTLARLEQLETELHSALERISELESAFSKTSEAFTKVATMISIHDAFICKFDLEAEAAAFSRQFEQEAKGLQ